MTEDQAEDSRLARGMVWGFIFALPVYAVIGLIGWALWSVLKP